MKKDLHEFEQHLKQKLDNAEFPFDEQNWEKARVMIDASRSNNRPKWIFFLSSIALIVTLGVVYYTQSGSSNNEQPLLAFNDVSNKQQSVQPSDMQPVNPATPEVETADATSTENTVNNSNYALNNSNNNTTNTTTNAAHSKKSVGGVTSSNVNHTEASSVTKNVSSSTSSENQANTNSSNTDTGSSSNSGSGSSQPNGTGAVKESAETVKATKPEKVKSTTQTEIPVVLGSNFTQPNKNNTTLTSENKGNNSNREGNLKSEGTPVIANNNNNNAVTNESKVTDSLAAVITKDVIQTSSAIADTNHTHSPVIAKVDSAANANDINLPSSVKPKPRPKFLFAEAGATYLFGWNVNGSQEANGFNAVAGINYQHYITPKVSLTAGLQYNSIGNLCNSTYTASSTEYNFGVQRDVTAIKYIRVHYISVPVKLGVNLGDKNIIGIGANAGFLLNSDSQTEKYRTNNAEPMNDSNRLSTKKETGYVTGFNSIDMQASVFYRRRIYKGLSANAEFIYGFTDIKKNDHFKNNSNERAMGVKVTLCLDLFKK